MLILAGVTISVVINDGVIDSAQNAKSKWEQAQIKEQTELDKNLEEIESHGSSSIIMLDGDGQTFYTLAPSTLCFRSSANIEDFQEVQINGETIDPSNYTITEGSTIINLSIDYLKTLDEDNYNISVVSKTGSPSARFSVVEPKVNSDGFYYNQPYTAYMADWGGNVAFFIRENETYDVINGFNVASSGTFKVAGNVVVASDPNLGELNCTISPDGTEIYCSELATNFVLGDESFAADEDYIYTYDSSLGGYVVNTIDKTKSSYSPIRTGINGMPTVALSRATFDQNSNLLVAPEIPDSVYSIGGSAFQGCTSLTSFVLPKGITVVEDHIFNNCNNLKEVTIPAGVTSIETRAFNCCNNLTGINFQGTKEQWNKITFGQDWNCTVPATSVTCSDGTVSLN